MREKRESSSSSAPLIFPRYVPSDSAGSAKTASRGSFSAFRRSTIVALMAWSSRVCWLTKIGFWSGAVAM